MRPHPFRRGNESVLVDLCHFYTGFNEAPPFQAGKLLIVPMASYGSWRFNEAPPFQAGKLHRHALICAA